MLSTLVTCAAMIACSANAADQQQTQSQQHAQQQAQAQSKPQAAQQAPAKFEILAIEQSIIDATNAERARYRLPALAVDQQLMVTARQHGNWMASYRQLVHSHINVAENIAMGQSSVPEVIRSWMNSSGHRANMLGGYRRIGVSAYRSPEGTIYWCQQFMP